MGFAELHRIGLLPLGNPLYLLTGLEPACPQDAVMHCRATLVTHKESRFPAIDTRGNMPPGEPREARRHRVET